MSHFRSRSLSLESLERRQVLNAGPISTDILLASVNLTAGTVEVSGGDVSRSLTINEHPLASSGTRVPFVDGDFNADGVTDLLAIDAATGSWWLQLNDGTQLFDMLVGSALPGVQVIDTADFNSDGLLDVVSIDTSNNLWVSLNSGTAFQHQTWGSLPTDWTVDQIFTGDFDGDGRVDVLSGQNDVGWQLASNQAGNGFSLDNWGTFPDFDWQTVLSGDFNGDNSDDVVALAPDLTWWFWQGGGEGPGHAAYFGHWKMANGWTDIGVGDFNGDGSDDVIGRTSEGDLRVGSSQGSSFNTWTWGTGWMDSAAWRNVSVRDLDGDGLADQLSQAGDDSWWYAHNEGGRFRNYYWQRSADVDFVTTGLVREGGIDIVDSMPTGGVDVRGLEVTASLSDDDLIQLSTTQSVVVDVVSFRSISGSLVPPENGVRTLARSGNFEVRYESFEESLEDTMVLTVGWNTTGKADLVATIQVAGLEFPIEVGASMGPEVDHLDVSATIANKAYFDTIA